jgi:hypothetical protein
MNVSLVAGSLGEGGKTLVRLEGRSSFSDSPEVDDDFTISEGFEALLLLLAWNI